MHRTWRKGADRRGAPPAPARAAVCIVATLGLVTAPVAAGSGPADETLGARDDTGVAAPARVFVTIPPLASLVERIGGDRVATGVLVEAGESPHAYEPSPRQLADLSAADVYFAIGLPFEEQLVAELRTLDPDVAFFDASDGIERRPIDESGTEHAGHAHDQHDTGRLDPHVWLAPANLARIAGNLAAGLSAVDPEGRTLYEASLAELLDEIDGLDSDLTETLASLRGSDLYVFHPAFGYFADAYGLRQVAIQTAGREPGARALADLVDSAARQEVRAVFVQPQFSERSAEAVAGEIGAVVVALDPLAYDCLGNLRAIADTVLRWLGEAETETASPGALTPEASLEEKSQR